MKCLLKCETTVTEQTTARVKQHVSEISKTNEQLEKKNTTSEISTEYIFKALPQIPRAYGLFNDIIMMMNEHHTKTNRFLPYCHEMRRGKLGLTKPLKNNSP